MGNEWVYFFWVLLAIGLFIVEANTFQMLTIWFSLGSLAGLLVAIIIPDNFFLQFVAFLIVSLVLLLFTRKIAIEKLKVGHVKTNVDSLVGKKAIVTKDIHEFEFGEVKIEGKYWTAKSEDGLPKESGNTVEVVGVSGVKLIVK